MDGACMCRLRETAYAATMGEVCVIIALLALLLAFCRCVIGVTSNRSAYPAIIQTSAVPNAFLFLQDPSLSCDLTLCSLVRIARPVVGVRHTSAPSSACFVCFFSMRRNAVLASRRPPYLNIDMHLYKATIHVQLLHFASASWLCLGGACWYR